MVKPKPNDSEGAPSSAENPRALRPGPRHTAAKSSPWRSGPAIIQDPWLPLADFDFLESDEFSHTEKVGEAMADFVSIVKPTPQQMLSVAQMNTIRIMGLRQPPGQTRRGARYIHPSGSGKSTCAKILNQYLIKHYGFDENRMPLLHATLTTTGTPKSLASSILGAVGDGYSSKGDADDLLKRVREVIREFKVELLVIDELNHIKGKTLAIEAANTIKNILTEGLVPIVLMGTTKAESLVKGNRELKIRCQPQVFLRPYVPEDKLDLQHWTTLMGLIDKEMVDRNIVQGQAGLASMAYKLCKASNGLIGEFQGIMLAALEAALMAREDHISYDRLSAAIDEWAVSDGTVDENPLAMGSSPDDRTNVTEEDDEGK